MNIWYLSDTHFNHDRIRTLGNRPFATVEEMNEFIIQTFNSLIKPRDTVYHLGDFAFGKQEEIKKIRARLNGKVHLIMGNHDYKNRIDRLKHLFTSVSDRLQIQVNHQKIILDHYPLLTWNDKYKGSWHLHAHSHNNLIVTRADFKTFGKILDVGIDGHSYKPWNHDEIIAIMATKSNIIEGYPFLSDHHNRKQGESE